MQMKPKRWWYTAPDLWSLRRLPIARHYKCGDEFCNDTLYLRFPGLGALTIRTNRDIRINNRCDECVAEFGPWCPGCQDCHQGQRCHDLTKCYDLKIEHTSKQQQCPRCGGWYCPECEPDPKQCCPYRGEKL